jgi:RNA polymerase sigma-70 factor (ECF subfamily)
LLTITHGPDCMSADQTFHFDNDALFQHILNDDAAFEQFFHTHFTPLCAWCQYKFKFDAQQAKEVVQTAFIKLWKARASLAPEIPVRAWLHRIIINNSLDLLKQARTREKYAQRLLQQNDADSLARQIEHFDVKKLQADIEQAIAELPDQMRLIFELSRRHGLKHAAIAAQLHISVNTVETQMTRALKKLRTRLGPWLGLWLAIAMTHKIPFK